MQHSEDPGKHVVDVGEVLLIPLVPERPVERLALSLQLSARLYQC